MELAKSMANELVRAILEAHPEMDEILDSLIRALVQPRTETREARLEEIERRRDSVLAECNPDLPTYEAK